MICSALLGTLCQDSANELVKSRVENFCFPEYVEGRSPVEKVTSLETEVRTIVYIQFCDDVFRTILLMDGFVLQKEGFSSPPMTNTVVLCSTLYHTRT